MTNAKLDKLVAQLQRHRPKYSAAPTDADELVMRSAEIIATARAEVDALRALLLLGLAVLPPVLRRGLVAAKRRVRGIKPVGH
jgi:hypothetical protein